MSDPMIRLSLEQSIEVQGALRRNNVSLAELKKLTSGDNLRKAVDAISSQVRYYAFALPEMDGHSVFEVYEYLKQTYGEDTLASGPRDRNTLPNEFRDGYAYFFFGARNHCKDPFFVPFLFGHNLTPGIIQSDGHWPLDGRIVLWG